MDQRSKVKLRAKASDPFGLHKAKSGEVSKESMVDSPALLVHLALVTDLYMHELGAFSLKSLASLCVPDPNN